MWKKPVSKYKRPSQNTQVEEFLTSFMTLWIGEKEICDNLRISPWQLRNWRKKWALPVCTLPSGHLALAKETFLRWMLVLGQHQLEQSNRYRQHKRDLETGMPIEDAEENDPFATMSDEELQVAMERMEAKFKAEGRKE